MKIALIARCVLLALVVVVAMVVNYAIADESGIQADIRQLNTRLKERFHETREPFKFVHSWPDVDRLLERDGMTAERLMAEVFRQMDTEDDERRAWSLLGISMYLKFRTKHEQLIPEMVPLLALDEPGHARAQARDVLWEIEGDKPNYQRYRDYLREQGDQVQPAFVRHLYERDVEQAMLTVAKEWNTDADRMRELRWKAHQVETARWRLEHKYVEPDAPVVDEGRNALAELAADEAWWVRLYAAHIATDDRPGRILSDDVLREKLKADKHSLVAEVANR